MLNKVANQPRPIIDSVIINSAIINVAVAVIHYQEQYLLGFRSSAQHQGNRYEFVGGKIESHETAAAALIREVSEETGIDIQDKQLVKLGRLHHDYGDKQVSLQVYKVTLTAEQYKQHQHCDYGLEGQALTWVAKNQLLAGYYPLPAANRTILAWLQLPSQITITYPLTQFSECTGISKAWLTYHQQHISKDAWVYVRTKSSDLADKVEKAKKVTDAELAAQLRHLRPDIYSVLAYDNADQLLTRFDAPEKMASEQNMEEVKPPQSTDISNHIAAFHLTHHELMRWFNGSKDSYSAEPCAKNQSKCKQSAFLNRPLSTFPLIVSCHDADSIHAANQLAAIRVQNQLAPVIGIFLSPVLATQSHPDSAALGWQAWSALARLADMPVIGLGGLSPMMVEQAAQYGAISIAGIRQFLQR